MGDHALITVDGLDVALSETSEIYSWAGAPRFEEGDIDELIPDGAIGTGPFAMDHWDIGNKLVVKKNPSYWRAGLPHAL